jgi:hypothetical protein
MLRCRIASSVRVTKFGSNSERKISEIRPTRGAHWEDTAGWDVLKSCTLYFESTSREAVAYPGILFVGGSTNSVEDRGQRERGSGGGSPLVRGSGGSCDLVQEI